MIQAFQNDDRSILTRLPGAQLLAVSPGRVNLLGEHVDYNGGAVLPAAIDRSVKLAAAQNFSHQMRVTALDLGERVVFDLDDLEARLDQDGQPLPAWALYPAGVAWALQRHGYSVEGIDCGFTSNVPVGSGLSSSAAVEVAFAALWQELGGWQATRLELALLCQEAENKYVGVNCGIMDQFACACGVDGHALYFDTRSLEFHPVPLPENYAVIIADSKMRRSLAGSAYNDRRASCEEALAILKHDLPQIRDLRDVKPEEFNRLAHKLPEVTCKRARHIVEECARVEEAIRLLDAGDAQGFGKLMFATHASLRDLYEVSIPELDTLVEIAASLPGCAGARLTGAGFGGCTVNLVEKDRAEAFMAALKAEYQKRSSVQGEIYLCRASQGVRVERL